LVINLAGTFRRGIIIDLNQVLKVLDVDLYWYRFRFSFDARVVEKLQLIQIMTIKLKMIMI
jgi:hypothetical protein